MLTKNRQTDKQTHLHTNTNENNPPRYAVTALVVKVINRQCRDVKQAETIKAVEIE